MNQGCWKVDDKDEGRQARCDRHHKFSHELWNELYKSKKTGPKAIYIDLEDEEQRDDDKEYSKWSQLPDLLLEKIFGFLTIRERYYASLVCRSWYDAFHLPLVWSDFTLEDTTLTRTRFNYYCGWQYVLDHLRVQMCLSTVGRNFKKLTIQPMLNFYNLYEFMNMISWYTEQRKESDNVELGIASNIHTLKFTFPCNMSTRDDSERIRLFGTGGKLLASLRRLMGNLQKLTRLELIDLMLEPHEAQYLLDEVCQNGCETLEVLHVVNTTRVPYQLLHVGVFLNLQVLVISPQNLGDEIVELLSHTQLQHLHILQNRYSPNDIKIRSISPATWKLCRKNNPFLSVHLRLESVKDKTLIWQEEAPVKSILYDCPYIGLSTEGVDQALAFYQKDLRTYGHKNLPRYFVPRSFDHRNDSNLLLMVRQCPNLQTLVITERVSTCTVLLIAYTGKKLNRLHIRGNAVILRCDWPRNPEWSDEFYSWLKTNSRAYSSVERELTQIFGYKWQFLSDKEFLNVQCNLHELN